MKTMNKMIYDQELLNRFDELTRASLYGGCSEIEQAELNQIYSYFSTQQQNEKRLNDLLMQKGLSQMAARDQLVISRPVISIAEKIPNNQANTQEGTNYESK